jgi:ribosomal protein L11 methyltransferase
MSTWQQLELECSASILSTLTDYLENAGAVSVTYQAAQENLLTEPSPGSQPLWDHVKLTGLFEETYNIEQLSNHLQKSFQNDGIQKITFITVEEKDWQNKWMEDFKPIHVSSKLWICPEWSEPPNPDAINIKLNPGLAFGTGSHPTTAMCLNWLDHYIKEDSIVLDFGCGSGILAIAALKLGAREAYAVDIDKEALKVTRENARNNAIDENKLFIRLPHEIGNIKVNVIVANILAQPLIDLAEIITQYANDKTIIALSGILTDQAKTVMARYKQWFDFETPSAQDGWILLSGIHIPGNS